MCDDIEDTVDIWINHIIPKKKNADKLISSNFNSISNLLVFFVGRSLIYQPIGLKYPEVKYSVSINFIK